MSSVLISLPIIGKTPTQDIEQIYKLIQSTPELGFTHKKVITDHIRENTERGTLWAAMIDGEVVGVCTMGSRRLYPHLARHGEIATKKTHRRQRIATALYTAQICQILVEGRREVEDTIIPSLSPWMHGPTDCGKGFLPSLGYLHYGTQPKRTGGFRDIALWGKQTVELDSWLNRLPKNLERIQIVETEKTKATLAKNLETYRRHDNTVADAIVATIERVRGLVEFVDKPKRKGLLT